MLCPGWSGDGHIAYRIETKPDTDGSELLPSIELADELLSVVVSLLHQNNVTMLSSIPRV
tara:strand:+ start:172 stop:351 length:180 start_codon:yes stop_codon:yes gene_type:complete